MQVGKVFKIFGKESLDWTDLYKIYELIQEDIKSNICKTGWTTDNEESRFTQTANYYRHGKSKFTLPDNPMTLEQADSFISYIIQKWLDGKSSAC